MDPHSSEILQVAYLWPVPNFFLGFLQKPPASPMMLIGYSMLHLDKTIF